MVSRKRSSQTMYAGNECNDMNVKRLHVQQVGAFSAAEANAL